MDENVTGLPGIGVIVCPVRTCYGLYDLQVPAQRCALPAAGEKKAQKGKPTKAQNQPQKRAESQPSGSFRPGGVCRGARCVRHGLIRKPLDTGANS